MRKPTDGSMATPLFKERAGQVLIFWRHFKVTVCDLEGLGPNQAPLLRNSDPSGFDDHKGPGQRVAMRSHQLNKRRTQIAARRHWPPDQNHSGCLACSSKNQLAEVLVFREQNAPLGSRGLDDDRIFRAACSIRDSDAVVPGSTQRLHGGEVAALIRPEAHFDRTQRWTVRTTVFSWARESAA
jgi:hypothetical protein